MTDPGANTNATEAVNENENSKLTNETATTSEPNATALTNEGTNRVMEEQHNGNDAAGTTAAEQG